MPKKISHGLVDKMLRTYTPPGWTVIERQTAHTSGVASRKKVIITPRIIDAYNLAVFLHEAAHGWFHFDQDLPEHMEEYEAEKWALKIFKRHGLVADRELRRNMRFNVARAVKRDEKRTPKIKINPKVRRWANYRDSRSETVAPCM